MENLIAEAERLANGGVEELTLIAQDTSAYGAELYGKPMFAELLKRLAEIGGLRWIRVLYAYPNTVTEELIDTMLAHDNIVKYIDMPIQHIDPVMLERMNRHGSAEHIRRITDYIRAASPEFILRTTVMLGFPGETEKQFMQLKEFLCEHPFDRVGAFAFSPEEGTPAALFPEQIPEETAARRLDEIMRAQSRISLSLNQTRVGRNYEVLVERTRGSTLYGRSYAEAPDVDGMIQCIGAPEGVKPGMRVNVRITGAGAYDLKGETAHEPAQ